MASIATVDELLPSIKPRTLTLGQTLILEVFEVPRGLSAVYERIASVVGTLYGTRNTYAKLLHAESFAGLNEKDRFRAWLIMATLGMDPRDGGGADTAVPAQFDVVELRRALRLPELDSNQQPAGSTLDATRERRPDNVLPFRSAPSTAPAPHRRHAATITRLRA